MSEVFSRTGIDELDLFLQGGLPKGFTRVLLGPAGAGAEIFAKQFTLGDGKKPLYISTDESEDEVRSTAARAGWPFEQVQIIDMQSDFAEAMLDSQQEIDTPNEPEEPSRSFDPRSLVEGTSSRDLLSTRLRPSGAPSSLSRASTDYLGRLIQPFARLRGPDRMVIHSIDFFLNLYELERVIATLTALKAANSKTGGQLLLVVSKGAHGGTVERRIELLADCLIELEMTRNGTTFDRFFMVKKVKNRTSGVGVSTYQVNPQGFTLETLERIV